MLQTCLLASPQLLVMRVLRGQIKAQVMVGPSLSQLLGEPKLGPLTLLREGSTLLFWQ